jgi:hypothetical protein
MSVFLVDICHFAANSYLHRTTRTRSDDGNRNANRGFETTRGQIFPDASRRRTVEDLPSRSTYPTTRSEPPVDTEAISRSAGWSSSHDRGESPRYSRAASGRRLLFSRAYPFVLTALIETVGARSRPTSPRPSPRGWAGSPRSSAAELPAVLTIACAPRRQP